MRPKRIILIRHGESKGNVDEHIYKTVPDHEIELTEEGLRQAQQAGEKLKTIIKEKSIQFYVSPCKRSWDTYEEIQKVFSKNQTKVYEEPRIREQDFGHFQDPEAYQQIFQERDVWEILLSISKR